MRKDLPTPPPILPFASAKKWSAWLAKNHAKSDGIWLQFFKKDSGVKTVSYAEALDEALCYGWIDGQLKKHDAQSWLHRFTPRRPRSMWSKRNTEHVARLTEEGRMKPVGRAQVEQAREDGRWQTAYDSHRTMTVPDDFLHALSRCKKSKFSTPRSARPTGTPSRGGYKRRRRPRRERSA